MKIFNYLVDSIKDAFVFLRHWWLDDETILSLAADARTTFAAGAIIGGTTTLFDIAVGKAVFMEVCILGWILFSMFIFCLKNFNEVDKEQ